MVHETYRFTWQANGMTDTLLVSEPDLVTMFSVLVFNRATRVVVEHVPRDKPGTLTASSVVAGNVDAVHADSLRGEQIIAAALTEARQDSAATVYEEVAVLVSAAYESHDEIAAILRERAAAIRRLAGPEEGRG